MRNSPGGQVKNEGFESSVFYCTGAGAFIVLGWVLWDFFQYIISSEPYLVVRLIPGSLLAIALGGVVGFLCGLHKRVFLLLCILACICFVITLAEYRWPPLLQQLPKSLVLLFAGAALAHWLIAYKRLNFFQTILPIGFCLALLSAIARLGFSLAHVIFFAIATVVFIAQFPIFRFRIVFMPAAVLGAALFIGSSIYSNLQTPRADLQVLEGIPANDAPNLLLIVLDTVRAQNLVPYGYHRNTTPGLNHFIDTYDLIVFPRAYSSSSWTLPSHASIFTGLLPGSHQADFPKKGHDQDTSFVSLWPAQPLGQEIPTLAEILADAGYHTCAVTANNGYLSHQFGLDRGFQHYDDRPSAVFVPSRTALVQQLGFKQELGRLGYRDAETITSIALNRLKQRDEKRPFFLFINYMDAHWPFQPPRPFNRLFDTAVPRDPLAVGTQWWPLLYDRSLSYLDRHLERLLKGLEERNLLDNTVIIITSDHGEAFGEHGFWAHGFSLYEEEIRVPLYLKPVQRDLSRNQDMPCTGADLFNMALRELGLPIQNRYNTKGIIAEFYRSPDRAGKRKRQGVVDETDRDLIAWVEADHKTIVSSTGDVETYDLDTDPRELHPIPQSSETHHLQLAKEWWDAHPPKEKTAETHFDPQLKERLRALGYVD